MPPIDIIRDVTDLKEKKDPSKLWNDLQKDSFNRPKLQDDLRAANAELERIGVLNRLVLEENTAEGTKTIIDTIDKIAVTFTADGARKEFNDRDNPTLMTKISRKDGSSSEIKRDEFGVPSILISIDKDGKITITEAKNGVTIECNDETGEITTKNADGTKVVQRTDGVIEHRDRNDVVTAYTDSSGRRLNGYDGQQGSSEAVIKCVSSSAVAAIATLNANSTHADIAACWAQLYSAHVRLGNLANADDPSVALIAQAAQGNVSTAMLEVESRRKVS